MTDRTAPPPPFVRALLRSLWGDRGFAGEAARGAERARTAADAPAEPPFREALETLDAPVMVISGGRASDPTDRYCVFANAAARSLLRIPPEGARLISVIRDPGVLAAIDQALFDGREAGAPLDLGGTSPRLLSAFAKPLTGEGASLALLALTDETEARRNEQARADFLANASHELRTPLASLSGFIETLRGHAKDDPVARDRFLDIMQAQADRMFRLVADLTSLSRIEQSEHLTPSEAVDLAAAASDVLDALAPVARERQVKLTLTLMAEAAPVITGDRDQIIQVVQNLVENAIKYSPAGETVQVTVEGAQTATQALRARRADAARLPLLTPDREGDAFACVRVEDRGGGIARENLPRLTERFYRVEGQKSGERLGTGLGLAIVKHIANRHRGGMVVESAVGEGAAFTVCLPLHRPDPVI